MNSSQTTAAATADATADAATATADAATATADAATATADAATATADAATATADAATATADADAGTATATAEVNAGTATATATADAGTATADADAGAAALPAAAAAAGAAAPPDAAAAGAAATTFLKELFMFISRDTFKKAFTDTSLTLEKLGGLRELIFQHAKDRNKSQDGAETNSVLRRRRLNSTLIDDIIALCKYMFDLKQEFPKSCLASPKASSP